MICLGYRYDKTTVASNHLPRPHRESPQAMRKLSDSLIASQLGQRRYRFRKKKMIFNQVQIVSHSRSCISQEKYIFNHSTLTLFTFRGFRSRNMHLIVSYCLVAVVPMHEFRSRSQVRYSDAANAWVGMRNILSLRGLFPSWSKTFSVLVLCFASDFSLRKQSHLTQRYVYYCCQVSYALNFTRMKEYLRGKLQKRIWEETSTVNKGLVWNETWMDTVYKCHRIFRPEWYFPLWMLCM